MADFKIEIFLRPQNFTIFEIFDLNILKNWIFSHLAFLTIERCYRTFKISYKKIVPLGGVQAPERGSFLLLFWNLADFGAKCCEINTFSSLTFYYGNKHHSLTRKIGHNFLIHDKLTGLLNLDFVLRDQFFSYL